ncbi:MAG: S8 family serine peptidase, partial [bacterium]
LNRTSNIDYGLSYSQLNQINVPAVHATGNYGQGVIVGSFDNGVRLLNHEAFDTLRTRLIATYDFVDHKVSVTPNNPGEGFGAHGVATLSAMGGYKPGQLIGPAFGASFIIARTENDSSETPLEEDNWVAAIEWAESLGVDVTSTSLGYLTYDPPYSSWTWQNMDGKTTVITRAADMAVSKGVVVVNSAGNNGFNATHNTLNAPADGDSVLSIGALTIDGERAGFSSVGPTLSTPPRIKPDVMAQGLLVRSAHTANPTEYAYAQGTSLSCPLAAGVAALLIHANPTASAVEIMNAMRQTASRASSPDREYGWGVINAMDAVNLVSGGQRIPTAYKLLQNYPNPFNPSTNIVFDLPKSSFVSLKIYNLLGQEVKTLATNQQFIGHPSIIWHGDTNSGSTIATGVYFARLSARSVDGTSNYASTIKLVFLR